MKRKKIKVYWNRVLLAVFALIVLIWLIALIISNAINKPDDKKPSGNNNPSSQTDNTTNANYDYVSYESSKINEGQLILVNKSYAYSIPYPTGDKLVNAVDFREKLTERNFTVKDNTVNVAADIMNDFNSMMTDFAKEKSIKTIILTSGLRTKEYQQKLYDEDLKQNSSAVSTLVALPGYSEHHTGYAIDFSNNDEYKANSEWFIENSYRFGFIQRYREDKKDITGIENEPWHFRYVGQPHAYLIKQNDYCLEEYIDYLKQYPFTKEHLIIKNFDDVSYEIYYVPATEETTKVPVPKNNDKYTVSGNNVDGFIVTVQLPNN